MRHVLGFFLVAAVVQSAVAQRDTLAGPGVSIELARYRAATVQDVRYDLNFDLAWADSARGRVAIRWRRRGNGDAFIDFRGRRLGEATVNGKILPRATFNGAHVVIPKALLADGENIATFNFVTDIAPSGASIIRSHDPDGSDYLYTLLVPADANQLFPCFDQPDLKARVSLTLGAPAAWQVVGNGSVVAA